ncbi:MAG: HIT domain-containing protein [Anaerolineaceae bacterium]
MSSDRPTTCVFCDAPKMDDESSLIVSRSALAYVILNRYPYTSGHIMVVPYAHVATMEELDTETRSEIMELITLSTRVLKHIYHPEGYNVGCNIGSAAGAGIAGHVHFHLVPRWAGDTNFMSTLAMARVLPEDLRDTLTRMKSAWE